MSKQILEALNNRDFTLAKQLIESINPLELIPGVTGRHGKQTILEFAIAKNTTEYNEIAKLIISRNPDTINTVDPQFGNESIIRAVVIKNTEIFKFIIDHIKFDVSKFKTNSETSLHLLAEYGSIEYCVIFDKKFHALTLQLLKAVNSQGNTAFDIAVANSEDITTWFLNLSPTHNINDLSHVPGTLGKIISKGYDKVAKEIIINSPTNILNNLGDHTPLYRAIENKSKNICDLLFRKMDFTQVPMPEKMALFSKAAENKYEDLCIKLFSKFPLDQIDSKSKITLSNLATKYGHEKLSLELISHMTSQEVDNSDALQNASITKMLKVCKVILDKIDPVPTEQNKLESLQREFAEFKKLMAEKEAENFAKFQHMQQQIEFEKAEKALLVKQMSRMVETVTDDNLFDLFKEIDEQMAMCTPKNSKVDLTGTSTTMEENSTDLG